MHNIYHTDSGGSILLLHKDYKCSSHHHTSLYCSLYNSMLLFFVFHPAGPLTDEAAVIQLRPIHQHPTRRDAGRSLGHPGAAENGPPDTICILDLLLELSLPNTPSSLTVTLPPSDRFICCVPSFSRSFSCCQCHCKSYHFFPLRQFL